MLISTAGRSASGRERSKRPGAARAAMALALLASLCLSLLSAGCSATAVPTTADETAAVATTSAGEATTALTVDATSTSGATSASDDTAAEDTARPAGWDEASHGKLDTPDYDTVFPQDRVNELTITIAPDQWEIMQANIAELLGQSGRGGAANPNGAQAAPGDQGVAPGADDGAAVPRGDQQANPPGNAPAAMPTPEADATPPADAQPPAQDAQPAQGDGAQGGAAQRPGAGGQAVPVQQDGDQARGGAAAPGVGTSENPVWVEGTLTFNGETWEHVGVRYKGNSSLSSGYRQGEGKLPLKLDFDEFEDQYPAIKNQRFYGFKQLSLANGFADATFMRDALASDLLTEAGLPAAETAFYHITLDYGEGPVDMGIYVAIEVVDDTVIDRVYGEDDGNIYEADGAAASFAEGTQGQIAASFQKENHEDEADWSDLEALYDALHASTRTSDPAAWRAGLEAVFNVDGFLQWLALAGVLQHWDTYGAMSHNYYLYHDTDSGQLQWISWDHNQVLGGASAGGVGGGNARRGGDGGGAGPGGRGVSIDRAEATDAWPLIRYLLDDPVYHAAYVQAVADAATLVDPVTLSAQYEAWADLLAPYVEDEAGLRSAVAQLEKNTETQHEAALAYVAAQQAGD